MKVIAEDIKKGQFHQVYLLYGEEEYLKGQYRDRLLKALVPAEDTMNFARFEGKDVSESEIISLSETMPFFADRRVILIENTGFFKNKTEQLPDYVAELPEYMVLICVESEVDKRNKMYKAVQKNGCVAEFAEQKDEVLMQWVLAQMRKEGKKIVRSDMELFLTYTGRDMANIRSELDKLLAYTLEKDVITREDIEAVCVPQMTNRIFDMVRAVAAHNQKEALEYYYDLLAQKEPAMRILFLLAREFNLIMQVKALRDSGTANQEIARLVGLPPFAIKRYMPLLSRYTVKDLQRIVEDFVQTEQDVKTGRIADTLSVEIMIIKYSGSRSPV